MRLASLTSLASLLVLPLLTAAGCSASHDESTGSNDEDLSAHPPIPYVLKYVGAYNGTGHVTHLDIRRTGRFYATIDGRHVSGTYVGPSKYTGTVRVVFVAHGESFSANLQGWTKFGAIDIVRHGTTEHLSATWLNDNESMCDDTGGSWTDDDADPATGLFCVCAAGKVYIPSQGGCVH